MSARWQDDALCREVGGEIFFPEDDETTVNTYRYTDAKTVCAACTVRTACLDYAMAREGGAAHQYRGGLWGGLTPNQRAELAKTRRPAEGATA
jgi:WhiB family redox-sensing transcriptional regulator